MYEVITFGSATVDLFADTSKESVVEICTDDDCEDMFAFPPGEKVLLDDVHSDIGGGGTNTAASLAKLGIPVAFGGCVGNDQNGDRVLLWLHQNKIDFVGTKSNKKNNISVVLDSKELDDRSILVYKGSSDDLKFEDLDLSKFNSTWFYFSSLLNQGYRTMIKLMKHARANHIAIAFNPSSYQAQQGIDAIRETIEMAHLLVLNKDEAEMLVGEGDRKELCRRLRNNGGEIVLVTDGGEGATLLYADRLYTIYPSPGIHVVETTGAGDCFASSFLAGLVMELSVPDALRLAFINSESLIGAIGPKNGLLSQEEALRRLHSDRRDVEEEPL